MAGGMAIFAAILGLCAFGLSLALTRAVLALAPALNLVDRPAARKFHTNVTPLGGGIAIYLAFVITVAFMTFAAKYTPFWTWLTERIGDPLDEFTNDFQKQVGIIWLIVGTATIQMFIGLIDDWKRGGLDFRIRLAIEIGLVFLLIHNNVCLTFFISQTWFRSAVTILWVVGLTNSLNFLDNMDALSGGVALWACLFFAAVTMLIGDLAMAACFAILVGSLAGFLRYNWNPAKIFMGDAGSNFLGFVLGALTIVSTFSTEGYSHVTLVAPLCILAIPIYDTTSVVLLRLRQGKSIFQADKQHLSHRLVQLGLRPKSAVLLIYLMSVTTGISGLLLYFVQPFAASMVLGQIFLVLGVVALLETAAHRRNRESADHCTASSDKTVAMNSELPA